MQMYLYLDHSVAFHTVSSVLSSQCMHYAHKYNKYIFIADILTQII